MLPLMYPYLVNIQGKNQDRFMIWSFSSQGIIVAGKKIVVMKDILLGFVGSKEVFDCARVGKHINPS